MQGRAFRPIFLPIVAIACLILSSLGGGGVASAQTFVSGTYNPVTGLASGLDSAGNAYMGTFNLNLLPPQVTNATFTPPGGAPDPLLLNVQPVPGTTTQFSITSNLPNQLLLSCSVDASTKSGTCILERSPALASTIVQSSVASQTGTVRSQAEAVTDLVTDRLRGASRDLAQGLSPAASPETPPGGTVILKDFSSNQPSSSTYRGLSAGSADARWSVWANASGSFLNNDTAAGYNGTSVVALTGLDYIVDQRWIAGFSAGYTHADLTLTPSTITRQVDGAVFGPYGSYILNSNMAIDALFNYTSLSNSQTAPLPLPSRSYHGDRLTGATDLDFFTNYNALKLTGYAGYSYTWEGSNSASVVGSSLANNTRYGAIRVGGEAAYPCGAFEPYLPITYEYETTTPNDGTSRSAVIVGAGVRYRWSDTLTAGLLAETTEVKTHTRDVVVEGHLRYSF